MAKKKLKKFLKKAAKAALIGGALYAGSKLLKGRKRGSVSTVGQPTGIDRAAHRPANLGDFNKRTDAYKPPVIRTSPETRGRDPTWWENIAHGGRTQPNKKIFKKGGRTGAKSGGRIGKQFGGGLNRPVAGPIARPIARPVGGVGASVRPLGYKKGGHVKSMGIAKRGGGAAKR